MVLDALLARGRAAAEALMVDACEVRRPTGETSDDDGNVVKTYEDVYAGKCRFQKASRGQAAQADVGEDYVLLQRVEVQFPMSLTGLQVGDEVLATVSRLDADLPGRVFIVRDLAHGTHKTARRVGVTERTT
ncbi:DUF6093 family protein [Micromonospora tulbaghiae]|uniref:DUF6093 family protein n=1 Tax=Micromonospora tulbaghiae TaxID=479978 RepID=UPI003445D847